MTHTHNPVARHAIVTGLACLTLAGAAASLSPLRADAGSEPGTTFVLDQRDGRDVLVDAPPRGGEMPTMGDTYVTSNHLLDPVTGDRIGRTHQECVTSQIMRSPLDAVADCTVVLVTPEGSLTLQAAWVFSVTSQELAITGGTGDYAGANGVATWTAGKGDASTWTIVLLA